MTVNLKFSLVLKVVICTVMMKMAYINGHTIQGVFKTYCDPAGRNKNDQTGRSSIDKMKAAGIKCEYTLVDRLRNVQNGIRFVKDVIKPTAGNAPRLFYVPNKNNKAFTTAMQEYSNRKVNAIYIDEPQDPQEFEHIPDALRYYFANRNAGGGGGVRAYGTT